MAKKHDADTTRSERILRLFRLLFFTGRKYSLPQLAQELDCSKQTVSAMADQINASGAGVVHTWFEGGRKWFQAVPLEQRPRLTLSPTDLQNLTLCRDLSAHLLPEGLRHDVSEAIATAATLLPRMGQAEAAHALGGLVRARGSIDYSPRQEILESLLFALAEHRVCRVTYRSPARDGPATYAVAPRRLVSYRDTLYVRCSYVSEDGEGNPDHDDMLLAVHRIEDLEPTKRTFPPEEGEGEGAPFFGVVSGEPFRVRVRLRGWAAGFAKERVWSADQTFSEPGAGCVELGFTATSPTEVVSWVLGFGANAEVLAPEDLREEVECALATALGQYALAQGAA
ncbi:MAG: WYL domain-containing protein [Deferrisomatales bacterium]|nr:WYL domain-containing protein [Deferrisomatales bacterium]